MLRYGVLSDTHGVSPAIEAALNAIGEVDGYLYLGDVGSDAERIAKQTGKPVHAVRGNCDTLSFSGKDNPVELVLELEDVRLLLLHGHRHEVDMYTTYAARQRAIELKCDALVYGHTHIPQLVQRDGIIVLNPGSPARPRAGSKPACAVIELENGRMRAKIITL
ncbi:MAG: metallophosphoesterase [Clostridia bacterium]|nr:metallophosphoesterase [Clostridia bacterium]